MKKFVKFILGMLPCIIVAYVVIITALVYLQKPLGNFRFLFGKDFVFTKIKEIEGGEYNDVDILFCGSSHTYRGFDTRIFESRGISCFNFGTSSQNPMVTRYLLEEYIDLISPRLVVFEIYPDVLTSTSIESFLPILSNHRIDSKLARMALEMKSLSVFNVCLGSWIQDLLIGKTNLQEDRIQGDDIYISGGYVQKAAIEYSNQTIRTKKNIDFTGQPRKDFEACLELLKSRNIQYLFVETPVSRSLYESYVHHSKFKDIIQQYGTYLDYNNKLHLDDKLDFYDADHLNQNGVSKFNNKFIHDLDSLNRTNKYF